jgi:hypothetical protein
MLLFVCDVSCSNTTESSVSSRYVRIVDRATAGAQPTEEQCTHAMCASLLCITLLQPDGNMLTRSEYHERAAHLRHAFDLGHCYFTTGEGKWSSSFGNLCLTGSHYCNTFVTLRRSRHPRRTVLQMESHFPFCMSHARLNQDHLAFPFGWSQKSVAARRWQQVPWQQEPCSSSVRNSISCERVS